VAIRIHKAYWLTSKDREIEIYMKTGHRLTTIFGFLFDPRIPLLFIIGAFVMAVAGNAAYSLILKLIGGESVGNFLRILFGSIIVLLIVIFAIKVAVTKLAQKGSIGGEAFKVRRKGIIYTAGMQTETIKASLDNQTPSFIGFLCSRVTEPYVERLLKEIGFDEDKYNKKSIDPQNINEIRVETNLIIDWMFSKGLKSSEIVVDVTGGMTTMSVGAFSLADELKIDTQYIKSEFDDKNRPIKNTQQGVFVRRYSDLG
jgi:hypothetical protein